MKNKGTFTWFMGLMGKRLPIYLCAVILSSFGLAGSKVANAYLIKSIVEAAGNFSTDGLAARIVLFFSLFVLGQLLWRFSIVRYNIEAKYGIARVEKMVFSKTMRLPMEYYEKHHSGEFMSKLIYDTEWAGNIYGSRFRRLSDSILSSIIYFIPMLILNVPLALCLLGVCMMSFVVNSRFAGPMKKVSGELSKQNGIMTEKLTNILSGMEQIKIFPIKDKLSDEYETANKEYSKKVMRSKCFSAGLESCNSFFDLIGSIAFLGLGVYFISKKWIRLGELTAIYTIYGSFRYVFLDISRYFPQLMACIANAERIRDFLRLEECEKLDITDSDSIKTVATKKTENIIEVENVIFSYDTGNPILNDVSFSVARGENVAITGPSGCGKSTMAKLLLCFYRCQGGNIKINGMDYNSMNPTDIRELISYVPQEPYLYNVSIADNIAYGMANSGQKVTIEEIVEAAKTANAHEFIMKLPQGYDTIPGERGNKLSGGEKQRIAIARAVIKNAPVFLLDEATSALDNESERLVNEAIKNISKDKTTIMIAHRSSTIAMADRVISFIGN